MNSLLNVWINGMAAVIADKDLFIFAIVMEVIGIISCMIYMLEVELKIYLLYLFRSQLVSYG